MRDLVVFLDVRTGGSEALYYEAAQALGLSPVVLSQWPWKYSGVSSANRYWTPSPDPEVILPILDQIGSERIAGFIATTSDRVELAARLSLQLGRPHSNLNAISICNNKRKFRHFLRDNGLENIEFREIQKPSEAYDAANSLGGRTVVKPLAGTGSQYVQVCMTPDEAYEHANFLISRKRKEILIEKYIDSPHFTVNIFNGKCIQIIKTIIKEGKNPIITGSDAPVFFNCQSYKNITSNIEKIIRKIELDAGPAMVEFRFDGTHIYPIEINPRLGLWCPVSVSSSIGIDIAEQCIKFACGIPSKNIFPIEQYQQLGSSIRHLVADGGGVRDVQGVEEALKMPNVKKIQIFSGLFTRFGPASSNADRIGYVHCVANTVDEASTSADNAIEKLDIIYKIKILNYIKYRIIKIRYVFAKYIAIIKYFNVGW